MVQTIQWKWGDWTTSPRQWCSIRPSWFQTLEHILIAWNPMIIIYFLRSMKALIQDSNLLGRARIWTSTNPRIATLTWLPTTIPELFFSQLTISRERTTSTPTIVMDIDGITLILLLRYLHQLWNFDLWESVVIAGRSWKPTCKSSRVLCRKHLRISGECVGKWIRPQLLWWLGSKNGPG